MAHDEQLAGRVRGLVRGERGVSEKRMFGGVAFLVDGRLAVSASSQGGLLLRVDPARGESLTDGPHVGPFVMRGRRMRGWLRVDADVLATDDQLAGWVSQGLEYARSLPPR